MVEDKLATRTTAETRKSEDEQNMERKMYSKHVPEEQTPILKVNKILLC